MGVTKTNLFTAKQNKLALFAKVFSHPARVAIIDYLLASKACINSDLVHELGLAQATISQHLREMKDIGLIQGTIEGTRKSYCINPARWQEIKSEFTTLFNQLDQNTQGNCC